MGQEEHIGLIFNSVQLALCCASHYRIAQNSGGEKLWRIW